MEKTQVKYLRKFLYAILIVSLMSLLWNLLIVNASWTLAWVNFVEKTFFFILIGIIFSYINPRVLELRKISHIFIISLFIAFLPTIAELIAGTLMGLFITNIIIRFAGATISLFILNLIYD